MKRDKVDSCKLEVWNYLGVCRPDDQATIMFPGDWEQAKWRSRDAERSCILVHILDGCQLYIILALESKMPQISLYVDEETLKKVEIAAKRQHISISKWVSDQIRSKVEPIYPLGYEDLFGSVKESELNRPSQQGFSDDAKRESL